MIALHKLYIVIGMGPYTSHNESDAGVVTVTPDPRSLRECVHSASHYREALRRIDAEL